jgi:hypothetical protein
MKARGNINTIPTNVIPFQAIPDAHSTAVAAQCGALLNSPAGNEECLAPCLPGWLVLINKEPRGDGHICRPGYSDYRGPRLFAR